MVEFRCKISSTISILSALLILIRFENVLLTEEVLNNTNFDGLICNHASTAKGILQVAETLTDALQQIIGGALEKYNLVEKSVCSLPNEAFSSGLKDDCLKAPPDCAAVQKKLNFKANGVYRIWPRYSNHAIMVYCDMLTDNGGWTVFQRRVDSSEKVDFFRKLEDYKTGFGNISSEFWLGNEALFALTNQEESQLRIELEDFEGNRRYAYYSNFFVDSAIKKYKLSVGGYSGDAGDAMQIHNGQEFSTFEVEGDRAKCAKDYKGGWWYNQCHHANLNGHYYKGTHSSYADGVNWKQWKDYHYSLKMTEMKIRPKSFKYSL